MGEGRRRIRFVHAAKAGETVSRPRGLRVRGAGELEDGEVFLEAGAGGDVVVVLEAQLAGDLLHDFVFHAGDVFVGSGDGEEAFEQGELLVARGQALEFARDQEFSVPPKSLCCVLAI